MSSIPLSRLIEELALEPVGTLVDDPEIRAVRPLAEAGPGDLSFLSNRKYRAQVATTGATAVLLAQPVPETGAIQLLCANPYATLARALELLYPEPKPPVGVHPSAVIADDVVIGRDCSIGPYCVIESGSVLGDDCILGSHVAVAADCVIGDGCRLFPHVVLYRDVHLGKAVRIHAGSVVGSDGFGYAQDGGIHRKVPQVAGVRIDDHVEIGSGVCIDRGALSHTRIGEGTKIDNQVQIGHGVVIGKHSIIVSQTGLSGSSSVGNYTVLAGKVGVTGHVAIGDKIVVMGDSVVTKNLDKPGQYAGNPAIPHMTYQRQLASLRRLPELVARVKALETAVDGKDQTDE